MDLDSRLTARSAPSPIRTVRPAIENPRLPLLAVILSTLPALWPLLQPGFFASDDGMIHVYRIAALARAWQHGVLYPRLFPEFGFGYGQAVLNFYAPLTYWPGAALTFLGAGPPAAAQITIALGFLLAALAAYAFIRSLWGPLAGILAAVVYTYFPYHLADVYVRGAVPEAFAFIWPPLILWAYTAAFWRRQDSGVPQGAPASSGASSNSGQAAALLWSVLAWAGLVYTHNLTALIFAPVAVLYVLMLAAVTRRWRLLVPVAGSLLLALLLSAPLWLPFLAESGSVGIALGPSDGYQKHLAPLAGIIQSLPLYRYRAGTGSPVYHPLSWLSVALFLLVLALALVQLVRRALPPAAWAVGFGLGLVTVSAYLTAVPSLTIWRAAQPVLAQLQYPWRFLAPAALGMAIASGALPTLLPGSWRIPAVAIVGLLAVLVSVPSLPAQLLSVPEAEVWAPDRMWREDAAAGQVGATWTGEFLPLTVREQRWALGRPLAGASDGPALPSRPVARLSSLSYAGLTLDVVNGAPMPVRMHQFYLPGWTALLDGRPIPTYPSGELALVTVDVPQGTHRLTLLFGETRARAAGWALATLGALTWAILGWWVWRRGEPRQPAAVRLLLPGSVVLLALALLLGLNRFGVGERSWAPRPAQAAVEDTALLIGYDVAPARDQNALDVTLYWLALRDVAQNYKSFVHLLDDGGNVISQNDGDPGGGYSPTTRWRPGEVVPDRHRLALPANLPSGVVCLKAGLYQFEPMRNLSVDPPAADNRVDLGAIWMPDGKAAP